MRSIERRMARKNLQQIDAAVKARKIAPLAKALDIDVNDPEWANISATEFFQVAQVRIADRIKRYQELTGEQK